MSEELPKKYRDALEDIVMRSPCEANSICYAPRFLEVVGLPAKPIEGTEFIRRNGNVTVSMVAPSYIGLPSGTYLRLLLVFIATQAKLKRSPEIALGRSTADLIKRLDREASGGTGPLREFTEQFKRTLASTIKIEKSYSKYWQIETLNFTTRAQILWWPSAEGSNLKLLLTKDFFEDIVVHAFPVDWRVVSVLAKNILAMDVYFWLVARLFRLKKRTQIPWDDLEAQFGNQYSRPSSFKQKFKKALKLVHAFYPEAKIIVIEQGVVLLPSKHHIQPMNMG